MHFCGRIIDSYAAGLLLLLFLRIVRRQIRRDAFPGLAVVARSKQKLRPDVNHAFLSRAHMNRRVPVVTELSFFVLRQRLNAARLERLAIDTSDVTALRFGIDVVIVGSISKDPEAITAVHVLPTVVGNAAGIGRVANPRAVVLQTAVDVVRHVHVEADVIELRNGQVVRFPPAIPAVI